MILVRLRVFADLTLALDDLMKCTLGTLMTFSTMGLWRF
jgi:hypothetical protein